jgi:hypothetical protein
MTRLVVERRRAMQRDFTSVVRSAASRACYSFQVQIEDTPIIGQPLMSLL